MDRKYKDVFIFCPTIHRPAATTFFFRTRRVPPGLAGGGVTQSSNPGQACCRQAPGAN